MSFHGRAIAAAAVSIAALVPTNLASASASGRSAASEAVDGKPFFSLIENRISVSRTFQATGPGHWSRGRDGTIDGKTEKQAYSFTHLDSWDYGTNYFDITLSRSGRNDPAAPCTNAGTITKPRGSAPMAMVSANCPGQTENYVLLRSTFGWNEIFNTRAFTRAPLRGISFEVGFDANHQNDYNAAAKRAIVAGLRFDFDLPYEGSLKVAPLLYYEFSNHSRFLECDPGRNTEALAGRRASCSTTGKKHYKPTWAVEISYNTTLDFLPEDVQYFAISGRATFRGPKGNQNAPLGRASGGRPTRVEINSEPIRLTFDAGKAFGRPEHSHDVDVWVAYRYWRNKFGLDADESPTCLTDIAEQSNESCTESSVSAGITLKL